VVNGKERPKPTGFEADWAPEPVCMRWKRGKYPFIAPAGTRNTFFQLVA